MNNTHLSPSSAHLFAVTSVILKVALSRSLVKSDPVIMARSKQSFSKKENEKKRKKKREDKEEKRNVRKSSSNKGKGFESMIAYVDEWGQISSTPPDPSKRSELKLENIQLGARSVIENENQVLYEKVGRVTFFNYEKGFGFIKDRATKESIFFHESPLTTPVAINDNVTFKTEMSAKGISAVLVLKIN